METKKIYDEIYALKEQERKRKVEAKMNSLDFVVVVVVEPLV